MNAQMPTNVSEVMNQAAQSMGAAMQAGAALQGEAMRWWTGMFQKTEPIHKMQRQAQDIMTDAMPKAQKNAGRYFSMIDNASQTSMELMRRAMEASQSKSYSEAQMHIIDFWQTMMRAMYTNANELMQINTHMMENWAKMAEGSVKPSPGAARPAAQAAAQRTARKH